MSEAINEICFIGATGVGKSSLSNRLLGTDKMKVGDDLESVTFVTDGATGEYGGSPIAVIDTQGMFSSDGKDAQYMVQMVQYIKSRKGLKGLGIVINYTNHRFDANLQIMLRFFWSIFPLPQFWQHICIIFTFTDSTATEEKKLTKAAAFGKKICELISQEIGNPYTFPIPCYFVNCTDPKDQNSNRNLSCMVGWLASLTPLCTCGEIQDPKKYKKVEFEERKRDGSTTAQTIMGTKDVDRMETTLIPIMKTDTYSSGGFLGFGKTKHSNTYVADWKKETKVVGKDQVQFVDGTKYTVEKIVEQREKRTKFDNTIEYGDWQIVSCTTDQRIEK